MSRVTEILSGHSKHSWRLPRILCQRFSASRRKGAWLRQTLVEMNECSSSAVSPADLSPSIQTTPLRASMATGGQVQTLSPPAGDSAGAQDQQAPGASSSSASSDLTGDAEGVWSSDIDQAFQEALAIYPPCGRRKIIISDEGKMYGRNELIARYIKIRCGKTRTRKQVSSHIQVLARKKARDEVAKKKGFQPDPSACAPAPSSAAASVSVVAAAAVAAATASPPTTTVPSQPPRVPLHVPGFPQIPTLPLPDTKEQLQLLQKTALLPGMYGTLWGTPFQMPQSFHPEMKFAPDLTSHFALAQQAAVKCESPTETQRLSAEMQKLTVSSSQLTLNGFTAYVEGPSGDRVDIVSIPKYVGDIETLKLNDISDKYPKLLPQLFAKGPSDAFYLAKCWANVHFSAVDSNHLFAVDSYYSSSSHFDITVSTKVCSFGNEVVEKVEVYSAQEEGGQYSFRLEKSPMCDYMVRFIYELKKLESETTMNNVLENFTVLQVITNKTTQETLMVLCFVFEVNREPETTCSLFRLTA